MNTLVLVGINNYGPGMGGATLEGCLHDIMGEYRWVHDVILPLWPGNINVVVLADQTARCATIKAALSQGVAAAGAKEWVALKQSSHGAAPGLVCYDSDWSDPQGTFLGADALGEIFAKSNPQSKMFMDIDACEFGDSMADRMIQPLAAPYREIVNRYIEDPNNPDERDLTSPHAIFPRGISNLATISGCLRGKTCADVRDALGAYGAFSHYELPRRQGHTLSGIENTVNQDLAQNGFDQRAVRTGPDWEWLK